MTRSGRTPVALTIAGSDSGGGAGIQADLKTFHAFGVFGTSALTAVTAQNTRGVQGVSVLDPAVVIEQIESVLVDLDPSAAKTGMLATAEVVQAVAELWADERDRPLVVDPVMVATSGDRLLDPEAVHAVSSALVPLAALVTPNVPEAEILSGVSIESADDLGVAARAIVESGARAVLLKGGHLEGDKVVDLFWDGRDEHVWRSVRIDSRHTHGTGCTLSAAITAGLARGRPLLGAVEGGLTFTHHAIASAPGLGGGHGPLNHWADTP